MNQQQQVNISNVMDIMGNNQTRKESSIFDLYNMHIQTLISTIWPKLNHKQYIYL